MPKVRNAHDYDVVVATPDYPPFEVAAGAISRELPQALVDSLLEQTANWLPAAGPKTNRPAAPADTGSK